MDKSKYIEAARLLVMMYGEYVSYYQNENEDEVAIETSYAEATALACAALINGAGENIQCPECGSCDVERIGIMPEAGNGDNG